MQDKIPQSLGQSLKVSRHMSEGLVQHHYVTVPFLLLFPVADSCHVHLKGCQSSKWLVRHLLSTVCVEKKGVGTLRVAKVNMSEGLTNSSPWGCGRFWEKEKRWELQHERGCKGNWNWGNFFLGNCWWPYWLLRRPVALVSPLSAVFTWGNIFPIDKLAELVFFYLLRDATAPAYLT